jgi:hypothetical protein
LPLLSDGEGDAVALPLSDDSPDVPEEADGEGVGSAPSSEPEPDASDEPDVSEEFEEELLSEDPEESEEFEESEPSLSSDALVEAEGDGVADASLPSPESSRAATQSLYSSAVRLFDVDGDLSSARASVGVNPMPMRTAVGIAAMAIALPAGIWNLVNSGFLGAAWRGPVLTRDLSTSVPWVTSSAGTVPPVRPVRRARS